LAKLHVTTLNEKSDDPIAIRLLLEWKAKAVTDDWNSDYFLNNSIFALQNFSSGLKNPIEHILSLDPIANFFPFGAQIPVTTDNLLSILANSLNHFPLLSLLQTTTLLSNELDNILSLIDQFKSQICCVCSLMEDLSVH
jgi:hypothetical protein